MIPPFFVGRSSGRRFVASLLKQSQIPKLICMCLVLSVIQYDAVQRNEKVKLEFGYPTNEAGDYLTSFTTLKSKSAVCTENDEVRQIHTGFGWT